jgi:hypothetical protein
MKILHLSEVLNKEKYYFQRYITSTEKQTLILPEKCNKNVKTGFCQTMCIEVKYRVTNDFSEWLVG